MASKSKNRESRAETQIFQPLEPPLQNLRTPAGGVSQVRYFAEFTSGIGR